MTVNNKSLLSVLHQIESGTWKIMPILSDATYKSAINFGMKKMNLTFYINPSLSSEDLELDHLDLENTELE